MFGEKLRSEQTQMIPRSLKEDQMNFLKDAKVINFIQGAKIRLTEDRGRGVFASRPLKYGELIVVEKAVAEAPTQDALIEKCTNLIRFKGIEFLRMSYMY